jgi:putative phage-type endonuclease
MDDQEWRTRRLGKVTASRISDLMSRTKTGFSASRKNYMTELILEHITNQPSENYISPAMAWGIDHEPLARIAYERMTWDKIAGDGKDFIDHPSIPMAGASPDGFVGEKKLVEIKCPNSATHLETLLHREIDRKYMFQMQFQMACTGRDVCDFVSFDPRMPENAQIKIISIQRSQIIIDEIETEVKKFLDELAEFETEMKNFLKNME